MVTTSDLKILLEDSEELRILKEGKDTNNVKGMGIYIGGYLGTNGVGVNAGKIF